MDVSLEDVQAWFANAANKEAATALLAKLSPAKELGDEDVLAYLETEKGRALLQPITDKRVTSAIKTHEEKIKDKNEEEIRRRVASEIAKLNPQLTPAEIKAKEAMDEVEKLKKERDTDKRIRNVEKAWIDAGLKPTFVKYLSPLTEEEVALFIREYSGEIKATDEKVRNELLANGYKPGSGTPPKDKKDFTKMSEKELIELEEKGELNAALAG